MRTYTESELQQGLVKEPVVITMGRERPSIALLQEMEDAGRLVINSAYGIESCKREILGRTLTSAGLRYPDHIISRTNLSVTERLEAMGISRCWVKRADCHSQHKEDITFAGSIQEAQEVVQEYFMRGIPTAVIERHVEGVPIKFYGVGGSDFFFQFTPAGRERREDLSAQPSVPDLRETCGRAAEALGLDIYGGDAIFDPLEGTSTIININDWPSFAPCQQEAVGPICQLLLSRMKERLNRKRK